jgi:CheY-like chemotaxis protein
MIPADAPLNVMIVEDEVLLAMELGFIIQDVGWRDVGHAMSGDEALALAEALHPDLALVDVHLSDGPTGVEVARRIAHDCGVVALFMTANVKRVPADFAGACGVIGKPYSEASVRAALAYLRICLSEARAPGLPPPGLTLAPAFAELWGLDEIPKAM